MSELYCASKKQQIFHHADADEVLYGGAAGGGKSYAIVWDAFLFCKANANVTCSIFRRTYPELEKSIILEALRVIPAKWYDYNKKEHRAYFPNGSILEFNYCLYDTDVYQFQSAQYDRIYFDELTHFNKFQYLYLLSRLRSTKPNIKPMVKSASNPGNVGHEWVKRRFIKGAEANTVMRRRDPDSYSYYTTMFIPARLDDNAYLTQDNNYRNNLMKLDKDDRRALLEGDWDVLKGQFFEEWRHDLHVIDPIELPSWWGRIRCMDWGYTKPAVVLWIAFSPEGRAYVYRELVVTKTSDVDLAKQIKDLTGNEKINYTVADPSMWSITQYERGESVAMRLTAAGIPVLKGDNNRTSGWNIIHSYLHHDETSQPLLQVFSTCNYLIETVPGMIHDQHKPEDLDTTADDHALDALRYGLMTKPVLNKKAAEKAPQYSVDWWVQKYNREKKNYGYVGTI